MARTRNLKPSVFLNEQLATCSPLARWLFAGLWCWADADGRLEDRPLRIKAAILPYDNCDTDGLLTELHDAGLILRYQAGSVKAIQIVSWSKHGNPHPKEPSLGLPATCVETETSPDLSGQVLKDSLCLNALTLTQNTPLPPSGDVSAVSESPHKTESPPSSFEEFWIAYPRKTAKAKAVQAWCKLAPNPQLVTLILTAVERQKTWDQWKRGIYSHASTWLNGKRWEDEGVGALFPKEPAPDPDAAMETGRREQAERRARAVPPPRKEDSNGRQP